MDLNKASTRCCPVSLPPASRCNCPPPLSARGSPNSGTGSRTTGSKGCWAGRRASGSSCRNSARILAPRERGSPSCSSPWTGIWATRSPGTSDSACPTSGCSTGRAGRTGPSSSSLGPLVSFGKKRREIDRCVFFFFNSLEKLCEGEGDKNLREEEEEELKGRRNK